MKLKKVASICSKTKIFCLYDREESGGEVSQWLGGFIRNLPDHRTSVHG